MAALDDSWVKQTAVARLDVRDRCVSQHNTENNNWWSHNTLSNRLKTLRAKRDKLLKHVQTHDKVLEMLKKKSVGSEVTDNKHALLELKELKLQQIKSAFRLTGVSANIVKNGAVRFCFDTYHQGHCFGSHYAEVKFGARGDSCELIHHSLPAFFPIPLLQQRLQDQGVQEFCKSTQDLLWAYVTRRQEAVQSQKKYKDWIESMDWDPACTDIKLQLGQTLLSSCPVEIAIHYDDLCDQLPSKVLVDPSDTELSEADHQQLVETICKLFQADPLTIAINTLCTSSQ